MRFALSPTHNPLDRRRFGAASCSITLERDGATTITVSGDLDHEGVMEIDDEVRSAVKRAPGRIVFDCSEVSFVDSSGLRLLVEAESMAYSASGRFTLRRPSPQLRTLLRISGLDELMIIEGPN